MGAYRYDRVKLRTEMERKGFRSAAALSGPTGLSKSYCRLIVGSGFIPPEHTRQKIAEVLGVPVDRIWKPVRKAA